MTIQVHIVRWEEVTNWAAATGRGPGDDEMPPLPNTGEEAQAVASLMASDAVVGLVTQCQNAVDRFRNSYGSLVHQRSNNESLSVGQKTDLRALFDSMRSAAEGVKVAAGAVHNQMRSELGSSLTEQIASGSRPPPQLRRRLLGRGGEAVQGEGDPA